MAAHRSLESEVERELLHEILDPVKFDGDAEGKILEPTGQVATGV